MDVSTNLIYDLVNSEEIHDAIIIEQEGFPPDEAASLDAFKFRQKHAPDLFLGVFIPQENGGRKIIGYICSTLSSSETLTHDSMSTHVAGAPTVCIHALCIEKQSRRKGIASRLLKEYITRLQSQVEAGMVPYERIVLLAHENLIQFYENVGFRNLGKSKVVHGSLPWYELRVDLKNGSGAPKTTITDTTTSTVSSTISAIDPTAAPLVQPNQPIPEGLWDALLRGSSRGNRPPGKLLSSFGGGLSDVIAPAAPGESVNKFDLLCPRSECGSVILKEGVAQWVERASEMLQPPEVPLNPLLASLPPPGQTAQWWLITPSPMAFENIGFSKPIGDSGSRKKLLACAECDLGPLGWCEEGGTEFWLACSRVAYRTQGD